MGCSDQTVVFQTPERICYDYRLYYGSEKKGEGVVLVKFDLKLGFLYQRQCVTLYGFYACLVKIETFLAQTSASKFRCMMLKRIL